MSKHVEIHWLDEPEEHDYPAALSFLSLIYEASHAESIVAALKRAAVVRFKAKDILRASELEPLDETNRHVAKNAEKVAHGKPLSPILLVRGFGKVIIADGYHRVSFVHLHDEDAEIPCKIV